MPDEEKAEEKHEGVTSRIRERIEHAKEATKEKINPFSKTNKAQRQEKREHQQEIRNAQREAYRKEEIHQATESGKHAAQRHYAPQPHQTRSVGKIAKGVERSSSKALFGTSVYGGLSLFQTPKKKPVPQRVTKVSKSGAVTITEPVTEPKKKESMQQWNPLGMENIVTPELHTLHSNPFNIEIIQQPKAKGFRKSKRKRAWRIGDMY